MEADRCFHASSVEMQGMREARSQRAAAVLRRVGHQWRGTIGIHLFMTLHAERARTGQKLGLVASLPVARRVIIGPGHLRRTRQRALASMAFGARQLLVPRVRKSPLVGVDQRSRQRALLGATASQEADREDHDAQRHVSL